jgi:hypothetical protein
MVDKSNYIKQFKELYEQKTGKKISDELAMEYFEKLVVLVDNIHSPIICIRYERKSGQ